MESEHATDNLTVKTNVEDVPTDLVWAKSRRGRVAAPPPAYPIESHSFSFSLSQKNRKYENLWNIKQHVLFKKINSLLFYVFSSLTFIMQQFVQLFISCFCPGHSVH